MQHVKTISAYCKGICISAPKQAFFDIRSFKENMPTVVAKMPLLKHEFYAIAIKVVEGTGEAIMGQHATFSEGTTFF